MPEQVITITFDLEKGLAGLPEEDAERARESRKLLAEILGQVNIESVVGILGLRIFISKWESRIDVLEQELRREERGGRTQGGILGELAEPGHTD